MPNDIQQNIAFGVSVVQDIIAAGYDFLNNEESISVKYSEIKPFLNKNIDNLKIEIKVKKGIWNHYILESWHIKEVLNH